MYLPHAVFSIPHALNNTTSRLDIDIECLGGLDEVVPRGEGPERTLHMGADEREAVYIAGVDPTKAVIR
jgi:hypothetical protein